MRGRILSYKRLGKCAYILFIVVLTLVILFPLYLMVVTALQPAATVSSSLIPRSPSIENFVKVFIEKPFGVWLRNSAVLAASSSMIAIAVASLASYSASRFRFFGRGIFMTLILGTQMIPSILLLLSFYIIFNSIGLINTHWALLITYVAEALPISIWLMKGFFDGVPFSIEEAALVDGCSPFQVFVRITLPLALPGVAVTFFYAFMVAWNEYMYATTLLSSSKKWTAAVGLYKLYG